MVEVILYVSGKQIFDVGFRPGLVQLADEAGVKVHSTNLRKEEKIRVIASGTRESVDLYHDEIKQRKVPSIMTSANYKVSGMKEYSGPDIDWNGHNSQFMAAQLAKTMIHSNLVFQTINQKLDNIDKKVSGLHDSNS